MMEYKRKLIEVSLPLEAINKACAREKSIRHGHPSTLHIWWARRPLAACRAVLFSSLVDDPSAHPDLFPTEAAQEAERLRLFGIIEELVTWENSNNERVLGAARAEIRRSCGDNAPALLDPFCGGGSIPLEGQRLGMMAYASDLNPVAVLISKALVEIPPKFAAEPPINPAARAASALRTWAGCQGLADDVRYYGRWMRDEARRRIGRLYPTVRLPPDFGIGEATVIAWIWARTVQCPNPACGATMPLVASWVLSKKPAKERWIEPVVDRGNRTIRYELRHGRGASVETVTRSGAHCVVCETQVPFAYVRTEGRAGRMGTQLMALVADGPGGRIYLPPSEDQASMAASADPPESVPNSELPERALGFRVQAYGMTRHRDLFTNRQLLALCTFSELVGAARELVLGDALRAGRRDDGLRLAEGGNGASAYADAIATYLAFAVDKGANYWSTICTWHSGRDIIVSTFSRQAIPMTWDFAEANPLSTSTGCFELGVEQAAESLTKWQGGPPALVRQQDARFLDPLRRVLISTDPPYYDNIGYADLSDFFYIWLRRSLNGLFPELFATLLTPKIEELVATPFRFAGSKIQADLNFEHGLSEAFASMREAQAEGFPLTIYYAFKQSETDAANGQVASTGWETMLSALLSQRLAINGTWPVRTELTGNLKKTVGALASSVVLVCRRRPESAALATRKDFLEALNAELPSALRRLQQGYVAPVDLAQAAIGPGMAVFSRFAKVVEADGSAMAVRTALGIINRMLDEMLAEQESDFDADTRWAVAWFEQFGMTPGPFGVAETLSKAKNSAVNALVEAGIVEAHAGRVRLLERQELSGHSDPTANRRLTVWEVTQHLIGALESGGEVGAADVVGRIGGLAETARELAYRLYNVCERKRWAKDAVSYNGLVVAWPAILRVAAEQSGQAEQMSLER